MDRREFCRLLALGAISLHAFPFADRKAFAESSVLSKAIPSSGEQIPVIGMGTWITFNVGSNQRLRDERTAVLKTFFELGGGMIDSSPMYGSADDVLGYGFSKIGHPDSLFSATKVWTDSTAEGAPQIKQSESLWKVPRFDLLQVHNLVNWQDHLKLLREMKEKGEVRYIGVTTSNGRRHEELEAILKSEPMDFMQLTYNIRRRTADERLLGLAADKGIAVIANRPFVGGSLIDKVKQHPFPAWAIDAGMKNWAEMLLQFIVSHPHVTCAIPATSKVAHMKENMGILSRNLVDEKTRERIKKHVLSL